MIALIISVFGIVEVLLKDVLRRAREEKRPVGLINRKKLHTERQLVAGDLLPVHDHGHGASALFEGMLICNLCCVFLSPFGCMATSLLPLFLLSFHASRTFHLHILHL